MIASSPTPSVHVFADPNHRWADARYRFAAGGSHYRLPEVRSGAFSVTVPLPAGSGSWLGARENILLAYQSTTAGRRALDREQRKSKGLVTRFGGCWILPRCPFFALGMSSRKRKGYLYSYGRVDAAMMQQCLKQVLGTLCKCIIMHGPSH